MDKLILHRVGLAPALLVVIGLAVSSTSLVHPRPAIAVEPSGSRGVPASSESFTEDLDWISQVRDHIHRRSQEDTIPQSRILEEISRMWHNRIAGQRPESTGVQDVLIGRLFGLQIDHITSLLNGSPPRQDTSGTDTALRLGEAAQAISQLSNLSPLVLAAKDSIRSSLLVISSVGCKCEIERCASMATLFASMQSDTLIGPTAMVDLMQVPPLEDLLGPIDMPYWILFSEHGHPATTIEGASDAEDVRSSVLSWLGTSRALEER